MVRSETKEGKIELTAACDGLFRVDSQRLIAVNSREDVMIATRKGNTAVKKGDKLAGMRVIPLIIKEETLQAAEQAAGAGPLLELLPYVKKTAAIVATGSEVKKGLIQDTFTPVVREKLAAYGIETISIAYSGDGVENVANAIGEARKTGADVILCTGGMSVDPDDNTPGGIKQSGARIVTYGAPVLPGAMFLLGYFEDGTPVMGSARLCDVCRGHHFRPGAAPYRRRRGTDPQRLRRDGRGRAVPWLQALSLAQLPLRKIKARAPKRAPAFPNRSS